TQLLACIRLCLRGQSCLHAPSTGCGPDVCAIRTSYSSRDCCSLPPEKSAPLYVMRIHYSLVIASGPKFYLSARPKGSIRATLLARSKVTLPERFLCFDRGCPIGEVLLFRSEIGLLIRRFHYLDRRVGWLDRCTRPEGGFYRSEGGLSISEVYSSGVFRFGPEEPNWGYLVSLEVAPLGGSSGGVKISSGGVDLRGFDQFLPMTFQEGVKSGLKLWKEKIFLIDRRAIPFHIPWRHLDSCVADGFPTAFNQDHVDRLKAHIVKFRDIPEGVLVRFRISRVWRNPMCDHVLRRSDNSVMSVYDFLCMPFLDKGTGLLSHATLEEIVVTRPNRKVVTKADNATKQKAFIGLEISTNATKKTRSSKKGSGAGSSAQAAKDRVEQVNDGTLDDGDQCDDTEFAMEDIESLDGVNQSEHINVIPLQTFDPSIRLDVTYPHILHPDKEVNLHVELSKGARRTTIASSRVSRALDVQPQDADDDGNGSDRPYYIPDIYDEGSSSDSPLFTKEDCEEIMERRPLDDKMLTSSNRDKKHQKYMAERDAITVEKAKVEEELVKTMSQLELRERQAEQTQSSVASFFQSDFTPLVQRFLNSGEFNQAFAGVLNTMISVRVERGLRMGRTDA
nr:hypothetical protein [Tanacetum cinerariifolium]